MKRDGIVAIVKKWQPRLGLYDWLIEVKVEYTSGRLARATFVNADHKATIRVDPNWERFRGEIDDDLESIVVHELVHLFIADFAELMELSEKAVEWLVIRLTAALLSAQARKDIRDRKKEAK